MNKKGFTLAEMLIVVIVISGLLFLIIPNILNTKSNLDNKTCEVYVELVNTQIDTYYLEHNTYPESLEILVENNYIKSTTCPDGRIIHYQDNKATIDES